MQRSGETSGSASIQAAGSPTGHTDALPYHLLHQSSGTSAASGMTEHQTGLRHVNTRKRVTCFTAASPRQALGYLPVMLSNISYVPGMNHRPPGLHVVTFACPSRVELLQPCWAGATHMPLQHLTEGLMLYHNCKTSYVLLHNLA